MILREGDRELTRARKRKSNWLGNGGLGLTGGPANRRKLCPPANSSRSLHGAFDE